MKRFKELWGIERLVGGGWGMEASPGEGDMQEGLPRGLGMQVRNPKFQLSRQTGSPGFRF